MGPHPYNPTIDDIAARWALHIVTSDVNNMLARFATGEVGQNSGESRQMADLVRAIKAHVTEPFDKLNKAYRVPREMYDDRTISYTYIHKRCHTLASFKTDKMGAVNALKRTIQTLVDRGDLIELGRKDASERYNTSSKCYVLLMPKSMGI